MSLRPSTTVLILALSTAAGCTGTYTNTGDIGISFSNDANGVATGYTIWNPFRDFVDDRNIPGGRLVPGDYTLETPIVYKRPTLTPGTMITWDDGLGCFVARSREPMGLEPGTALAIVEESTEP